MATAKQRAAAMRNIKKAQAALRKKRGGRKRTSSGTTKRRTSRRRRNPAARTKRTTTTRRRSVARKRAPARRRRRSGRRRNPAMLSQLKTGIKDAVGITVGKAGARIIPTLVPQLPRSGVAGLVVQAASALALGFVADRFASRDVARMVLAGGLSAPIESLAVAYNVPFIGPALQPTSSSVAGLGTARRSRRLAAYANTPDGLGAYANEGSQLFF